MRTEPCKQCNAFDFYERGEFSYCRPCHSEAQKRYKERKVRGEEVEILKPPNLPISVLRTNHAGRAQLTCKNGHPLTGDNVRISSQRNGRHLFRRCRTCERNAKRVKYGLPIDQAPVKLTELLDSLSDD